MAHIITMADGRNSVIMDLPDFLELADEYMGMEAVSWLKGYLSETYGEEDEIEAYEEQLAQQKEEYKKQMAEICTEAGTLASLIREKELDRAAISRTAGRIGSLTWREGNRP